MIATEQTQSLTDFRLNAAKTLERLNRTGEAEVITVNGEARAVLLSPAAYDQLAREAQLARDVALIRQSMKDLDEGKGIEAIEFLDGLRAKLLAIKANRRTTGKAGARK